MTGGRARIFPLEAGEVHVWQCHLDRLDPAVYAGILAADEKARRERFPFPHLRARYTVARGVLRMLAGRYLGVPPGTLRFLYGEQGKPELKDLFLNLSHSGNRMAAAFSLSGPVGLDIEEIAPRLHGRQIAKRYFTEREQGELAAGGEEEFSRRFFQLWTAKEAVMKATGLGFALGFSRVEIGLSPLRLVSLDWEGRRDWELREAAPGKGFSGTLACVPGCVMKTFSFPEKFPPGN